MSLEAFPCRDSKHFFAASLQNVAGFAPPTLRDLPLLEAYIAGSVKRKLSVAESSKSIRSSYSSVLPGREIVTLTYALRTTQSVNASIDIR